MARPGVTYFDIANVASLLLESGENPTIDKVRQKLGSGSNSTIANHLKKWKKENMPTTSMVANTTIPSSLLSQVQSLWDHLKEEARKNIEQTQNELITEQNLSKKQNDEIENLNSKYLELIAKNNEQLQLIDKYKADHAEQRSKINLLESHVESEKKRVNDKEIVIEDLKVQLTNLHNNFEHFQKASIEQRHKESLDNAATIKDKDQEIQRLLALTQQEQQKIHSLMIEQEKLQNRSHQIHMENQQRKDRVANVLEQNSQLKKQIDSFAEETRKLYLALDKAEESKNALVLTNQNLEKRLADSQKMIEKLNDQLEKKDEQMERVNQKNFDLHESNGNLQAKLSILKETRVI